MTDMLDCVKQHLINFIDDNVQNYKGDIRPYPNDAGARNEVDRDEPLRKYLSEILERVQEAASAKGKFNLGDSEVNIVAAKLLCAKAVTGHQNQNIGYRDDATIMRVLGDVDIAFYKQFGRSPGHGHCPPTNWKELANDKYDSLWDLQRTLKFEGGKG